VALIREAIKGEKTIKEMADIFSVHPATRYRALK
jgi:hypothetical protein